MTKDTRATLLRGYADIAERNPQLFYCPSSTVIQGDLTNYLRIAADDPEEVRGRAGRELLDLVALALVQLDMAGHGGGACRDCAREAAAYFGEAIARCVIAFDRSGRDNTGSMH